MLSSREDSYFDGNIIKVNLKVSLPCTLQNTPLNFIREIMIRKPCTASQALVFLNLAGGDLAKVTYP